MGGSNSNIVQWRADKDILHRYAKFELTRKVSVQMMHVYLSLVLSLLTGMVCFVLFCSAVTD